MARKYLVTGGLGFIGASLSRELLQAGHSVRILDNSFRGAIHRLGDAAEDVEIFHGDIRDPSVVQDAVSGVDSVCHLAYVNGTSHFYERPAFVLEVAVKGMMNVIDACVNTNVGELILASSSEVYQTPPTTPTDEYVPLSVPDVLNPRYSYGGGKIICELLALNYGREHLDRVVVFRPHNVYGPDMGWKHVIPEFVARICKQQSDSAGISPLPFQIQGDGRQTRSFIYIDDFTRAALSVIERGEHQSIYHIGTMDERSIADVARCVAREIGVEIDLVSGPIPEGGTLRRCPDTKKLAALGFQPQYSLEEGLQRTVPWYVQQWTSNEKSMPQSNIA